MQTRNGSRGQTDDVGLGNTVSITTSTRLEHADDVGVFSQAVVHQRVVDRQGQRHQGAVLGRQQTEPALIQSLSDRECCIDGDPVKHSRDPR
ncbi:hypothetical protein D3C74_442760 [compost metagenome]